jgi:flagellin
MSLTVGTNVMALMAQKNLALSTAKYSTALSRLSSGYRINSAADDPAGLAISERLKAQINGSQQAASNAQDAISMIQTGEGALNEVSAMLQNINQLAVQAANGTLGATDLTQINSEMQQLQSELNQISQQTKFNGNSLLDGSLSTTVSGGTAALGTQFNTTGGKSTINSIDVTNAKAGDTFTLSGSGTNLTLTNSAGVAQTISVASGISANGTAALSFSQLGVTINMSTDSGAKTGAGLVTDLATKTITTTAGTGSANFQIGADATDTFSVAFSDTSVQSSSSGNMLALYNALNTFNTTQNAANAQAVITAVNNAIDTVDTNRGNLGSAQVRLTHASNSLAVAIQNLTASQSNIANVDVATETTNMVAAQIQTQAATSILSQANQFPQSAVNLIRGQP